MGNPNGWAQAGCRGDFGWLEKGFEGSVLRRTGGSATQNVLCLCIVGRIRGISELSKRKQQRGGFGGIGHECLSLGSVFVANVRGGKRRNVVEWGGEGRGFRIAYGGGGVLWIDRRFLTQPFTG